MKPPAGGLEGGDVPPSPHTHTLLIIKNFKHTEKLNKLYSEQLHTHHLDSISFYLLHHVSSYLSIYLSIHLIFFLSLSRRVANFSTLHL